MEIPYETLLNNFSTFRFRIFRSYTIDTYILNFRQNVLVEFR